MNKIILSLSMIAMAAAVIVGGTMAYFSDTAKSESNSFHSGTLDLKLSHDNSTYSQSITGTFNTNNMAPGGTGETGTVWVKNTGTVPADHIRITSVVNTPSDNGMTEPECKAYNGEWKEHTDGHEYCIIASYSQGTCTSVGGDWNSWGCYTRSDKGFKDDWATRNDVDEYLQITSIKYAGKELVFLGHWVVNPVNAAYTEVDVNRNGYLDLDDLETVAATEGSWLDNLKPVDEPHTFQMTVKLHENTGNVYQTDKDGIKITFQLNQDSSQ